MYCHKMKTLYVEDIAMLEHELIGDSELLEWKPEDAQFYLQGMHDFAKAVIKKIKGENKEEDD